MQAVLLAAGVGNRLGNFTKNLPKSLIPLNGRPILDYVLRTILALPLEELIVVGGFAYEKMAEHLKGQDSRIHLLENEKFRKGSILTLCKALPFIRGEFFLFNADHIYSFSILPRLLKKREIVEGLFAACDFDRPLGEDDMKIRKNAEGALTDIGKTLNPFDGGYTGITYCSDRTLRFYQKAAQDILKSTQGQGVVEDVLRRLISMGHPPRICDISNIPWLEVDTQEDLKKAKKDLQKLGIPHV